MMSISYYNRIVLKIAAEEEEKEEVGLFFFYFDSEKSF